MSKTVEGKEIKCPSCEAQDWVYICDKDYDDYVEAVYECINCGKRIYVELAD